MKLSVLNIVIIVVILLTINTCKEPQLPDWQNNDECYFPPNEEVTGYDYIFDSVFYEKPYFNPNNPDEFIYIENGYKLIKYNMATEAKTELFNDGNQIYYQPKWSRTGWIAFNKSDYNIYVMKDNGDSLIQLTNNGSDLWSAANFYGEFNYNGDSLLYSTSYYLITYDHVEQAVIVSDDFSTYDTIFNYILSPLTNWQKPGYLLDYGYVWIGNYNIASDSIFYIPAFDTITSPTGIFWLSDKINFIYYKGYGIYQTNSINGKTSKLKEMCPYIFYLFPSYSETSGKVIACKVIKEWLGDNKVSVKSHIVLMNPDGSNEITILPKP